MDGRRLTHVWRLLCRREIKRTTNKPRLYSNNFLVLFFFFRLFIKKNMDKVFDKNKITFQVSKNMRKLFYEFKMRNGKRAFS